MQLNDVMRAWARKNLGVAADASDEAIKAAYVKALTDGKLNAKDYAALAEGREPAAAAPSAALAALFGDALKTAIAPLVETVQALKGQTSGSTTGASGGGVLVTTTPPGTGGGQTDLERAVDARVKSHLQRYGLAGTDGADVTTPVRPSELMSRAAQNQWLGGVRVKGAHERYNASRKEAFWPSDHRYKHLQNKRVTLPDENGVGMGRALDHPSELDKAVAGVYAKWLANLTNQGEALPPGWKMTDHDWDLLNYAIHEMKWTGCLGGKDGEPIDGVKLMDVAYRRVDGVKALLDDSVSGGIFAAPVVVEDAIILVPLLYGELFPLVTVTNVARGRRFTGPTMGTPTFTSGIPEGTPIPLFDTTNFLGSLDTTIFTSVGAMEIGNDLEEDGPYNLGAAVISRWGEAALQWLDRVIALGDGVTEPKGIFNTAGLASVSSANSTTGPLLVSDFEGLMFGVTKAYRTSRNQRNIFIGNEVNYRRARAIPLGATGWENSRAFGSNYADYTVLGHPFKIVPTVPNTKLAYVNLGYYRMYRRLGLQVVVEMGGKELRLKNVKLIVCRMRYGGQLEQGGSGALMTNAPT
jgi:hypothetical protein